MPNVHAESTFAVDLTLICERPPDSRPNCLCGGAIDAMQDTADSVWLRPGTEAVDTS
jgi:hypothetical protein